jgi:hypothetical protein
MRKVKGNYFVVSIRKITEGAAEGISLYRKRVNKDTIHVKENCFGVGLHSDHYSPPEMAVT